MQFILSVLASDSFVTNTACPTCTESQASMSCKSELSWLGSLLKIQESPSVTGARILSGGFGGESPLSRLGDCEKGSVLNHSHLLLQGQQTAESLIPLDVSPLTHWGLARLGQAHVGQLPSPLIQSHQQEGGGGLNYRCKDFFAFAIYLCLIMRETAHHKHDCQHT